ncbi:MAG: aminopeptidase P family N-terminal domain-containing protein, partial [Bacteroidales bacterium]|nr:aminopeptidase P family N-terminal domain-containing protein [Bacteroidales bacterium]
MEIIFAQRVDAIRALMREHGWDAVILTGSDPHASEYPARRWKQVEWVSGFTGEAGDLCITLDHAGLWTDTRYFIQAVKQLAGTGIELHKMRVPEQVPIPEWLALRGFEDPVIAVDGLCQTVSAIGGLKAAFGGGVTIASVPDLLASLWEDRPAIPSTPIITLGEDLTGESREARIHWLRLWMMRQEVDAIFLSALDEIAWLLNVRGSDVEYNPVVISYLLVTMDQVYWFVRKDGYVDIDEETQASFDELVSDEVTICDYDEAVLALATYVHNDVDRIFVDPSTLNIRIRESLDEDAYDVVEGLSPVPLRKSVKNAVEIEGMREAHVEDGLAMEK